MKNEVLTRARLTKSAFNKTGVPKKQISSIIESVFNEISDALVKGESVKLSSFGVFKTSNKKSRIGRNPKTGEEVMITPRRVVSFKVSKILKEKIE